MIKMNGLLNWLENHSICPRDATAFIDFCVRAEILYFVLQYTGRS
jgi:hypothetical protein